MLSILLFQTAERSIVTCIRRNERHYNSSGISASKISLTSIYFRRTKVYNKLHICPSHFCSPVVSCPDKIIHLNLTVGYERPCNYWSHLQKQLRNCFNSIFI